MGIRANYYTRVNLHNAMLSIQRVHCSEAFDWLTATSASAISSFQCVCQWRLVPCAAVLLGRAAEGRGLELLSSSQFPCASSWALGSGGREGGREGRRREGRRGGGREGGREREGEREGG